ncbi:MAG: hypothetical protein V1726_04465 [Methanobacteriota archaeon]
MKGWENTNWKEFFKPNIKKILFTAVFFFLIGIWFVFPILNILLPNSEGSFGIRILVLIISFIPPVFLAYILGSFYLILAEMITKKVSLLKFNEKKIALGIGVFVFAVFFHGITYSLNFPILRVIDYILLPYMLVTDIWMRYVSHPYLYTLPPGAGFDITFSISDIIILILFFALSIIYWYAIGCVIFYYFKKFKNRTLNEDMSTNK